MGHIYEGHAIVSADDRIADANGDKPAALDNPADWARFQAALAEAAAIVMGRLSHEASPNRRKRNRVVMSRSVSGLVRHRDAWWWNPEAVPLDEAMAQVAPDGGMIAVPGGCAVFDWFVPVFDAFHLARNPAVTLPGGVPVLPACNDGLSAEAVLSGQSYRADATEMLDAAAGVTMTVWRRFSPRSPRV